MGASLLAIAVGQSPSLLTDLTPLRAGSLPQNPLQFARLFHIERSSPPTCPLRLILPATNRC
ncbi:hypothetical protein DZG01_26710 [Pseudomonas fluorescens]|nr:hypothetical protein DZG01_26710 [Pseudomonas fluorescens]